LQRRQFLRRVLSCIGDISHLLCQKLFCGYKSLGKDSKKGIFSQEDWKIVAHYGFLVFATEDPIWGAIFRVEYSIKQPQAICIPQPQ
jgi:hypothetical protein